MADKNLNTRIQLKTDTEVNWSISNLIPKKGEVIIYSADNEHASPRIKIGDGINIVPFSYIFVLKMPGILGAE